MYLAFCDLRPPTLKLDSDWFQARPLCCRTSNAPGGLSKCADLLLEFDAGDINRIVAALNRTQILNARAALLAPATAALAAVRWASKRYEISD